MATGSSESDQDTIQQVQEFYRRRESSLKLQMIDVQQFSKMRGRQRRKAVIGWNQLPSHVEGFHSTISVEPEGRLGEYFALKVAAMLPRGEEDCGTTEFADQVDEPSERKRSLPVTLAVFVNKQYIVGPKGLLVGTSQKCNLRLPMESGVKEQHFRVRAVAGSTSNEEANPSLSFCAESCIGEEDLCEIGEEHLPQLAEQLSSASNLPFPAYQTSSIALTGSNVFMTGQFVWQVSALPARTVASLQAFEAVRSENLIRLRSVLETQDNRLRLEGQRGNLEEAIFDINGEEKVGEEGSSRKESLGSSNKPDGGERRGSSLSPSSSSSTATILLHIAVQKENLELVELLLKKGADPNSAGGPHRRTALHYAAEVDNAAVMSTLLAWGGDAELKDINAMPPLQLAHSHKIRKLLLNAMLLCSAALEGCYEEVECCLRQPHMTPNLVGLRHKTALQLASIGGHSRVVSLLLDNKASVDQCGGSHSRSALHYAAYHGHTAVVVTLLKGQASIELKDVEGNTPLNLCSQAEVLNLLSKETTPSLCDAIQSGDLHVAEQLIVANAGKEGYLEQRDSLMNTPLHIACRRGQLEMVRLLKKYGTNVNVVGGVDRTPPICAAAKEGYPDVVEYLIGMGAEIEGDLSSGGRFSVRELVERMMEQCERDLQQLRFVGRAPSHWDSQIYTKQASHTGWDFPVKMCEDKIDHLERVYELLFTGPERLQRAYEMRDLKKFSELLKEDSPVSPNCVLNTRENISALAYFCEKGEYDYCKVLIEAGAKLDVVGQTEQMPLLVVSDLGRLELVRLLVEAGADPNLQALDTQSCALHEAATRAELGVLRYLIKSGARRDLRNVHGETPFDLAISKEARSLLASDEQEVLLAASQGDLAWLEQLRGRGYDPCQLEFHCGWQALHEACKSGHLDAVRMLLEGGASLNRKGGPQLRTPLHLACLAGHREVVSLLLAQPGIRPSISSKDASGSVPYEVAASNAVRRLLVLHNPVRRVLSCAERKSIDQNLCIICRSNAVEVVLIPCNHKICCYECAEHCHAEWKACPLCRGNIKNIEHL